MEQVKKYFKRIKWDSLIISILTIAVGVLCVALPQGSANVLCIIFGCALIIMGCILLIRYFVYQRFMGGHLLIFAIVMIISAIFCFVYPAIVQSTLTILFGLFIVIESISSLADSIYCARANISGWWMLFILSIATTFLGIGVMFANFSTVIIFAGVALIVEGIVNIISTIVFSKKIKQAKKKLKEVENNIVIDL